MQPLFLFLAFSVKSLAGHTWLAMRCSATANTGEPKPVSNRPYVRRGFNFNPSHPSTASSFAVPHGEHCPGRARRYAVYTSLHQHAHYITCIYSGPCQYEQQRVLQSGPSPSLSVPRTELASPSRANKAVYLGWRSYLPCLASLAHTPVDRCARLGVPNGMDGMGIDAASVIAGAAAASTRLAADFPRRSCGRTGGSGQRRYA